MCDGEFGLRDLLMLESDQTHYRMICITFHWFMLFLLLLCAVGAHASAMVPCRGQRTMCGKNSFFFFHSPRSFQGSNLDPQAWQWAPLPADPSVHPLGSDAFWVNWLMDQAAGSPVTWWNIIFESVWGRDMILWPNRRLTDSPSVGDGIVAASFSQGCVQISIYHRQGTNRPKSNSTQVFLGELDWGDFTETWVRRYLQENGHLWTVTKWKKSSF